MLSQLASPHSLPQTTLAHSRLHAEPQTMLSAIPVAVVPQTILSPVVSLVPHTMLSHAASLQSEPQTTLLPVTSLVEPHTVETAQADPAGLMPPFLPLRLPQRIVLPHAVFAG